MLDGSTGSNFLVEDQVSIRFSWTTEARRLMYFRRCSAFTQVITRRYGVTPSDFHLNTFDNQGAAGFTGLDFSFTAAAAGQPNANLVLTGFTSADLTNGRLT